MIAHKDTPLEKIRNLIVAGEITLAGNKALRIYGQLTCYSGKRMKVQNRVFFKSESEAIQSGYRPCAHCMKEAHKIRKGDL